MIDALTERLSEEPISFRHLRCSAYHQNSALHPFAEYLESWLGIRREDSSADKLRKLEGVLATQDFPPAEGVQLLSGLLSLQLDERFSPLTLSPEAQRTRTLELLVALLLDSAEGRPAFIIVEDLHWADPSTLAILGLLMDQAPTARVLALFSFRPEFSPPWGTRAYVTPVLLNRLTRRLATDMVDRLTRGKSLPAEIITQVTSKSDGVPLFVEELISMVLESGLVEVADDHYELTGPLPPLAIPSTLQDSLTARLDKLSLAREVVQLGAILGREFSYELMQAVSPLSEDTLRSHLQQLVDTEFLYQRGSPPDAIYTFKHALIQDAAYETLLRSTRQQYHQRTATSLEKRFPELVESEPEMVAHHYTEAGLMEQAVYYWQLAGERALDAYAHEEAHAHFLRGIAAQGLALEDSESAEDGVAAALLFGLGRAQAATLTRHEMPKAHQSFSRAFDYYASVGDTARVVAIAEFPFPQLSEYRARSSGLITRALGLVPDESLEAGRLHSYHGNVQGMADGDYDSARESFVRALAIARREGNTALEMRTLGFAAQVELWHHQFEESLKSSLKAIDLASASSDPRAEVAARYWACSS
ncbi:MAG: hypothetical protein BZY81_01875 [SAR202 cluster bacterium Io17-Chloro-G4]|nr:MAG: hypothetical protein BZY81_01875 [SAR202 cluster bacterium Io17-Chloro-G4]